MVNPVDDSDAEIFASADSLVRGAMKAWKPPARLRLSEWADRHFYLSAESAAEPGRWKTLPYQRGIMDAITDPYVEQVSVMKSARVGYTKIVDATIGYYMHQDPCPIMVVQPTIEDAQGFSKEEIAPMLRDCPELSALLAGDGERDSDNTILHKVFRGGSLSVVGANSGRGFRRVSRKIVIFDEVDGYPASAGKEGDQIKLGIRRTEYYHDRKIISGSTPLLAGNSRIETMFLAGDQRRYFVPCTHCAHMDFLVFRENSETGGHFMHWPKGKPEDAHFICSRCGCEIEHKDKREIVTHGEWRAGADFHRHASFHVWAAYSFSPNATWGQLAAEFVEANANGPDTLKTFVNTVAGRDVDRKGRGAGLGAPLSAARALPDRERARRREVPNRWRGRATGSLRLRDRGMGRRERKLEHGRRRDHGRHGRRCDRGASWTNCWPRRSPAPMG
jgi:phage terminase large subunit GpA-like protein